MKYLFPARSVLSAQILVNLSVIIFSIPLYAATYLSPPAAGKTLIENELKNENTNSKKPIYGLKVPFKTGTYDNIDTHIKKLVEIFPEWQTSIKNSKHIFIKPNRVDFSSENAEVTPIPLIQAVINEIKKVNENAIIYIGERAMSARDNDQAEVISQPLRNLCSDKKKNIFRRSRYLGKGDNRVRGIRIFFSQKNA